MPVVEVIWCGSPPPHEQSVVVVLLVVVVVGSGSVVVVVVAIVVVVVPMMVVVVVATVVVVTLVVVVVPAHGYMDALAFSKRLTVAVPVAFWFALLWHAGQLPLEVKRSAEVL